MAEAAENDPNNTVGQVITVGGSLTGGDIFNFTSENTANSTALRFYGENLDIPMTGSGVYTINGNGGIISQAYGMVFGSSEDVESLTANCEQFVNFKKAGFRQLSEPALCVTIE